MGICTYINNECANWDTLELHCDFTPDHKYCKDRPCTTLKPDFMCIYMGPDGCFFPDEACKEVIEYCRTNKCINIDSYLGKNYCKYVREPIVNCNLLNKTLPPRPPRSDEE